MGPYREGCSIVEELKVALMRLITLLVVGFSFVWISVAQEQSSPFSILDHSASQAIDSLFAEYDRSDAPGFAVGVIQGGELVYAKGFGSANLDYHIPISTESVFNLASLSKQMTAACIALLIQQGKVSLDADVKTYISEFPDYPGPVKVKHLIYMTSGLNEYYRLERPGGKDWFLDYFTVDDAIALSLEQPELDFVPGSAWAYSNINYMLLAEIVERVSGMTFASFAEQYLFEPLGMHNTHVNDDTYRVIPDRVIGYNPREEGGYYHYHRHSPHYGGSGVHSTIEDLYKWDQNFYTHELAGKGWTELMLSTMKFDHDKTNDAFGLAWGDYNSLPILWYSGGDTGFSTYMVRFPEQELTVICLSNFIPADGYGLAQRKAIDILDILYVDG